MCSGTVLLADEAQSNGQDKRFEDLFRVGEQCLTYRSETGLHETIERLLRDEEQRPKIDVWGRQHVLEHHIHRHLMQSTGI